MKGVPEERAVVLGEYIIANGATVRQTAKEFGISKSTVHKDVSQRLRVISPCTFDRVQEVLRRNREERHIRGGMATRQKYLQLHR